MKLLVLLCVGLITTNYSFTYNAEKLVSLRGAIEVHDKDAVETLIKGGADVNVFIPWVDEETALMIAAKDGLVDIMTVLIDAGADVNAVAYRYQPHAGKAVLVYAIESGIVLAVEKLIQAGANVNEFVEYQLSTDMARNTRYATILSFAISEKSSIEIIRALIIGGAHINETREFFGCWTPLMVAAYTGYSEAVALLLSAGADRAIQNPRDHNKTAWEYAQEQGHVDIVKLLS